MDNRVVRSPPSRSTPSEHFRWIAVGAAFGWLLYVLATTGLT